jgi:hypothetical protein
MECWDYDEPMWEPSEADKLFDEMIAKLMDAAKSSIKSEMEALKSQNEYLRNRIAELEAKAHDVRQKELDLEYKAKNLRKEVENEFYETAIDKLFKDRIENVDVWFAELKSHIGPKCKLCNDERMLVHTFPNGQSASTHCDCSKIVYCYEPSIATLKILEYHVKPSRYASERKYYMYDSRSYKPNSCYDDNHVDFRILHIVENFDDNVTELYKSLGYSEKLGFKTQEECMKYCAWRNEQKE